MVEVLVTIVVVAIGLLGLAGLQVSGLRANTSSEARSKATLLASDIIERMRANPLGVDANAYSALNVTRVGGGGCSLATPAKICSNTSTTSATAVTCTATEMATFDAWVWGCGLTPAAGAQRGGVINLLPNGSARVTCLDSTAGDGDPCTLGSPHRVVVNWSDLNPEDGAAVVQNITLVVTP